MSRYPFSGKLLGLFDTFGSAFAVAAATRNHRQPKSSDLRRLGIDPEQFRQIGRL